MPWRGYDPRRKDVQNIACASHLPVHEEGSANTLLKWDLSDLLDCIQTPCQGNEGDGGVNIKTQLGKRAASTRQDSDEAIDTCNFVEKLRTNKYRGSELYKKPRTANKSATITPFLMSRKPKNEESGQSLHSGRSVNLIRKASSDGVKVAYLSKPS